MYRFRAVAIEKITDGDTYWLRLDVGFREWKLVHIRLNEWDTPELRSRDEWERSRARAALAVAEVFIASGIEKGTLWVDTHPDPDSWGRWLADIFRDEDLAIPSLGHYLAELKLATRWPTRWYEVYGDGAAET